MATWIIGGVLAAIVAVIIINMVKDKCSGKGGCDGNCGKCHGCH